jgi:hypothetical protein
MVSVDSIFEKAINYLGETVSRFVSAVFVLFLFGAIYGAIVVSVDPFYLVVPAVLALLAYYSRTFAVLILIIVLVLVFL